MKAWLMDAYRADNKITLWIKTPEEDVRLERGFKAFIYIEAKPEAETFLKKHGMLYFLLEKQTYMRKWKRVFAVPVPCLSSFEGFVRWIELETKHGVPLYNADIAPEQMFLYEHNLRPCSAIGIEGEKIFPLDSDYESGIPLKKMEVRVVPDGDIRLGMDVAIKSMVVDNKLICGKEEELLNSFAKEFAAKDPDVLVMDYAFSRLPYLVRRLETHNISCPFHRWDQVPITYRGGKSFYSYGNVRYQDFAIRLHGRFLVDASTMVGSECEVDAIVELCQLTGACFQQLASRSFGAAFQSCLVREIVRHGFLVPFKEKPLGRPLSMAEMIKADRAAHTFDSKIGFHTMVAEIDFCSMFPWIIYNHNISAETILSDQGPFEHVPGIPVRISLRHKGLVPIAIKPILDRRMEYKKNPTRVNKERAVGLKWILVTSYGYLRFREFKLGIASSHMAVCSYARETLIAAANLAEENGFEVVHGIVDSLYLKNLSEEKVHEFCRELEIITGIPVGFEGMFKWIVFLPSINDRDRHVPCRYFGVFANGEIKARGIEVRMRGPPAIVKYFQQKSLEIMSECSTEEEIVAKVAFLCRLLKMTVEQLPSLKAELLACSLRITKKDYKSNIPQKKDLGLLRGKGISVLPGQLIRFVFQNGKVVLPEDYNGKPDVKRYRRLLIRCLYVITQPFGFDKDMLERMCEGQTRIGDFANQS